MSLAEIRTKFASLDDSVTKHAMLSLIDKLLVANYDEVFSLEEKFRTFEMMIPERSGRIIIVFDAKSKKYSLFAQSLDQHLIANYGNIIKSFIDNGQEPPSPWKLVLEGSIRDLENPIRELDSFVDRVRPLLPVAWKH